jgi:CRISPR-associated protein Cas6
MNVIDVSFGLRGTTIPADHGWPLFSALSELLPWLDGEPQAGVHPIHGGDAGHGMLYLGARARLILRVTEDRADASFALQGARLQVGEGIEVGMPQPRLLIPHGTLYSPFVVAPAGEDEEQFEQALNDEVRAANVQCKLVCGRPRRATASAGTVAGFAVMLYDLSQADSLKVQVMGLGPGRKLGCGVFVPHKSAAAVA